MLQALLWILVTMQREEMTFSEIIQQSRSLKYAFLLDGLQANILLLMLEVLEKHPDMLGLDVDFNGSSKEVLRQVKEKIAWFGYRSQLNYLMQNT